MSQQAVELVQHMLGAVERNDLEAAIAFAHPEIVLDATRRVFNPRTYVGIPGLRQLLADMADVWENVRAEYDEVIGAGDRVVVIGRMYATGKGSGVEVQQLLASVLTVDGDRIRRWEIGYKNRREALEAAGVSE